MPYSTPEKRRAGRKRTYPKNRNRILTSIKTHRKTNPECYRRTQFKRRYGITIEQFDRIFTAQGGCCALPLCREVLKVGTKAVHVDHCHKTGKVRGILCARCNLAIGFFKDDPERLRDAANYLEHADVVVHWCPAGSLSFG